MATPVSPLLRGLRRLAGALPLLGLLGLGLIVVIPALLGYQRYVITGGSMGESLPRGSVAYEEVVPTGRIQIGDVITYRPPNGERLLTHRVQWIWRDRAGRRLYRTRGDANAAPDRWTFLLPHHKQARVVFHVPLVGYALAALSIRGVRMAVIGGPALAIALFAFASLRRDRRERREPAPNFG